MLFLILQQQTFRAKWVSACIKGTRFTFRPLVTNILCIYTSLFCYYLEQVGVLLVQKAAVLDGTISSFTD